MAASVRPNAPIKLDERLTGPGRSGQGLQLKLQPADEYFVPCWLNRPQRGRSGVRLTANAGDDADDRLVGALVVAGAREERCEPASSLGALLARPSFGAVYQAEARLFRGALAGEAVPPGLLGRVAGRISEANAGLFVRYTDGSPDEHAVLRSTADVLQSAAGGMLVVNKMQRSDPTVAELAESVRAQIGFEPNVNMYSAPAGTPGLSAHHDPQDVLIVQTEGSKQWRVCAPVGAGMDLPTRVSERPGHPLYYRYNESQLADCWDAELRPGDVLYLPRGTVHAARTARHGSVHLTFGLDADFIWGDFLKGLRMAGQQAHAERLASPACLPARERNKIMPHKPLELIGPDGGEEAMQAVGEVGDGLRGLGWAEECGGAVDGLVGCAECMQRVLWLMRRIQMQAHANRPNLWSD